MAWTAQVYELTRAFPREELYGLTSQLRRAIVSVPSNIAEGWGRGSRKEYAHFVSIAKGSILEAQTLIELARMLGYLAESDSQPVLKEMLELERMLSSLRARLTAPSMN